MRNNIQIDKEFNIISRSIDNATSCKVIEVGEDCFKVKLKNSVKYEKGESCELFAMTPKGQVYFETLVKEVENDMLSIWFPLVFKYLQRREYYRISLDKQIEFAYENQLIPVKIIDLSAGGLKVFSSVELKLLREYKLKLDIENKILDFCFVPIRIETYQNGFICSGKFENVNNSDRIALVQYCYRKYIENSIK